MTISYVALMGWSFLCAFVVLCLLYRRLALARPGQLRRKKGGLLQPVFVRGQSVARDEDASQP